MFPPINTIFTASSKDIHCPCGTGKPYDNCCGIFIHNQKKPETPEVLMRSRYCAYTQANLDYIEHTMKGPAKTRFDKKRAENWAKRVQWLKLEVLQTSTHFTKGYVEFIAYFKENGKVNTLHERSEFHYENGEWFYVDGEFKK